MTTALTKPDPEPVSMEVWEALRGQAAELIRSGFLPAHIRTPEQAVAIVLIGRELGIPMMYALRRIVVINGTPTLSAELMLALARRTGELEELRVEDDGQTCTVTVHRRGQRTPYVATFSMDDAQRMGLAGKDNWRKQPRIMRQWRAISAALRVTFPDAIGGLHTPEEIAPDLPVDCNGMPAAPMSPAPVENPYAPRRVTAPAEPAATQEAAQEPAPVTVMAPAPAVSPVQEAAVAQEPAAQEPAPAAQEPTQEAPQAELALGDTAPREAQAPDDQPTLTISIGGRQYHTAGLTRQQALAIFRLRQLLDRLTRPGHAKEILGREFGVEHWYQLTPQAAGAYIAALNRAIQGAQRKT